MPSTLIITHFSMRYATNSNSNSSNSKGEETESQLSISDLLEETRSSCSKETKVLAAIDLWSFEIPRKYKLPKKPKQPDQPKVESNNTNVNKQEE